MALDTLDLAVIVGIVVALGLYFGKDYIFGGDDSASAGFVAGGDENDRDLLATLKKNDKNAVVFFGSQTGTAEDYATKLAKELHSKFGLNVLLADLADYEYDNFQDIDPNCLFFFLVATYGEGEPTDNAVEFFNWLDDGADQIANAKYTVFGLGNSTYEFYNAMGAKLNEKFESLGADRFAPYGQGDDGLGTMDEDFISWKEECFESLKSNIGLDEREVSYEPSFKLVEEDDLSSSSSGVSGGEPNKAYVEMTDDLTKGPFGHSHPYLAPISVTKELFNSKARSCVHVEFDISGSNLKYTTGDHLAIWPSNSNESVERFLSCFGLEEKRLKVFTLKALDSTVSIPFHVPIFYEAVVRHHMEISGPISRQTFVSIAPYAPNEEVKEKILALGNDKKAFASEINEKQLNLADALLKVSGGQKWTNVPFVFLIELIPTLQPRYYSISSSSLSEKGLVHVTAVVEAEEKDGHLVAGVATNLLKDIETKQNKTGTTHVATYDLSGPHDKFRGFKLPVHVRRSTFKLPSNPGTPVILVGPGTGVAPMRGFIRERCALLKNQPNMTLGKSILFYGCRQPDEDFLYKDEWAEYSKQLGSSFEIDTAFSRVSSEKVYVQDKILARAHEINKLLEDGAFIYVCGDASRMARDVQSTFVKILSLQRGLTEEKAAEFVRSLKVQNRYQEDVW